MSKLTTSKVYYITCHNCDFQQDVDGEYHEALEAAEDHLRESLDDDYGYKNVGHVVELKEATKVSLAW